jgi:adenylate cyclase
MVKLIVSEANSNQFEFAISKSEIKIGRDPNRNDLVLPAKQVSGSHALLKQFGKEYLLLDLNSTNGIYIKDEKILERRLKDGDLFSIGHFTLEFVDEGARNPISYNEEPLNATVLLRPTSLFTCLYEEEGPEQRLDQADLELKLQEKVKILETLYALGKTLSSVFDISMIFEQIVDLLFQLTPADRCAILLIDPETNTLDPRVMRIHPDKRASVAHTGSFAISRTITSKVIEERLSLLSIDAQDDHQISSESIAIHHIHSVMCVPMLGKKGVLGVIYVDKFDLRDSFNSDGLDLLNAVASQAAIALDNAQAYELLAREAVARASFERFMPNHIIDIIMQSPQELKLGGMTQPVTILFADIRGFTAMAEKSHPEVVVDVLNRFFSAMTEIIFANLGTLDKYMGDGLMAMFGAPYSSDEDAINAVNSAIAMQRRMVRLNTELQNLGFVPIKIGIGINTGEVTVGCIGSERRMDYTAIGNAVNLAARLMQQAQGHQILIGEATYQLLGDVFRTHPVGDLSLKGLSNTTMVYEVSYG